MAESPSAVQMFESSSEGIVMIFVPSGNVGRLINSFSILNKFQIKYEQDTGLTAYFFFCDCLR